jgi:ABC-type multidrug transport system fused ATPase/permease subunit
MGILQEINKILNDNKDFFVKGSISYASQEPWIISDTIKENILMGNKENIEFYEQVINCCSLNKDLENFKDHGDETKIGDMGITLSGVRNNDLTYSFINLKILS